MPRKLSRKESESQRVLLAVEARRITEIGPHTLVWKCEVEQVSTGHRRAAFDVLVKRDGRAPTSNQFPFDTFEQAAQCAREIELQLQHAAELPLEPTEYGG